MKVYCSHVKKYVKYFKLNYDPILEKVESWTKIWKQRGLSLYGKILIINTLIISLFVHKFTVLPLMPNRIVQKLELLMKRFLWNEGKPKISKKKVQGLKTDGGAGLINLRCKEWSMKLQWIFKLKDPLIKEACYKLIKTSLRDGI